MDHEQIRTALCFGLLALEHVRQQVWPDDPDFVREAQQHARTLRRLLRGPVLERDPAWLEPEPVMKCNLQLQEND